MTEYIFLAPIDVLFLRGNRLFGGAGDHSESLMPPWPSLAAGALRTRMLADAKMPFSSFVRGDMPPGPLTEAIGTPECPGPFRISWFTLARREGRVKLYFPMPADLIAQGEPERVTYLQPSALPASLRSSFALDKNPVLRVSSPAKPRTGLWLNIKGLLAYLAGEILHHDHLLKPSQLWTNENRLGIALDPTSRTAAEHRIYTSDVVALKQDVGFVVGVDGAEGCVPMSGLVRYGGDGKGAEVEKCDFRVPEPPWHIIEETGRFKLVLSTPGLFAGGWLPPGVQRADDGYMWSFQGLKARLVASITSRPEVVSGWDMARDRPKDAIRAVPVGSVYWFEDLQGGTDGLKKLLECGLWDADGGGINPQRRAEGFNNVIVASWPWGH